MLDDLGLLADIMALGSRIDRLHGADAASGRTVLDVRYDAQKGGRFGLAVHRAALFGVLFRAAQAAGIAIETGIDLETIDTGGQRATLVTADGRRLGGFDLVVDATGARSKLKRLAQHPSEPKPLAYGAFWASLAWRGDGFDAHALLQRYHKASVMIGVLPIGRPRAGRRADGGILLEPEAGRGRQACARPGLLPGRIALPGYGPNASPISRRSTASTSWRWRATVTTRWLTRSGGGWPSSATPRIRPARSSGRAPTWRCSTPARWRMRWPSSPSMDDALQAYARMRRLHVRVFQALSFAFTPFYQSDSTVLPFIRDRLVATIARIPPGPQFLASMVAGTVVDPFGPIGLTETDWRALVTTAP